MGFFRNINSIAKMLDNEKLAKGLDQILNKDKISEAIAAELDKQSVSDQKGKKHIFKSKQHCAFCISAYIIMALMVISMAILCLHGAIDIQSTFFNTIAMAVIITYFILLVGLMIYGLYLCDALFFLPFLIVLLCVGIMATIFSGGGSFFVEVLSGKWIGKTASYIIFAFGILSAIVAVACLIRYESYESAPTTRPQQAKKHNPEPSVDLREDRLPDMSKTVPPKEVKQDHEKKVPKIKPKEHTQTTAFSPAYTLTVFYKFLSVRHTMVIKNDNKKKIYQIKRANFDVFHPTIRLIDVSKKVIARVVKSKPVFSRTIQYKLFLQDDLLAVVYQDKKAKETLDLSNLGMVVDGNIHKCRYSVYDGGGTPVIKVKKSSKRNAICAIEYLSKEDEMLGILILMTIKLAFKKEQG